jgi:hypothetical protein
VSKLLRVRQATFSSPLLLNLLQYPSPSRIGEAEPYLRVVITHWKRFHGEDAIDMTPELYLASVLAKQPGEDEAATTLNRAMNGSGAGPHTYLWAQAAVARDASRGACRKGQGAGAVAARSTRAVRSSVAQRVAPIYPI